jgi:photosystem II stability/assembly factor-like uncharacterized protein
MSKITMSIKSFVIFLTLTFFVSIGHAQWVQTSGPSGGTITSIAVLGGDVFAGTASGVFRSTDGGASWSCVTTGVQNASIQGLAVIDTDLFAATTTGVVRSTNKGVTWTEADQGFTGNPTALFAVGTDLFLVPEVNEVFRSSDFGATWDTIPTLTDSAAFCFAAMGGIYFAGTEVNGIVFSTDSGVTWAGAGDEGFPEMPLNFVYSLAVIGTDLFAASDTAIFLSSDSGTTWNALAGFPGFGNGASVLTVVGSKLFAGTGYGGGLYFSSDTGKSWTAAGSGVSYLNVNTLASSGNSIFAGTYDAGMFISTDGGVNWQADDSGLVITNVSNFAVLGPDIFANCNQIYAGDAGNLFITNDQGGSWADITSNVTSFEPIMAIAASGGNLFAVSESPAVYVSMDSGMTWNTSSNLGSLQLTALFPTPNALFATSSSGIFQSTDEGTTWLSANSGIAANDIDVLSFAQGSNALYCGSSDGAVYTSTDNGAAWDNISPSGSYGGIDAIATVDGNLIVGSSEGLFLSSDNGMNWSDAFIQNFGITSLLTVGSNVFAGTTGGIFVSTDGGVTWKAENQGLSSFSITALIVNGADLYAGTTSAGVWRRPLSQMINFNGVQTNVTTPTLEQNYPNPFTRQTTIPFSLTQTEHVTITIFNVLGQQVAALADQDFAAGAHEVVWNAGSATSGTYVCQITTSDGVQTESLVLEGE